jgi:hypothetical protein
MRSHGLKVILRLEIDKKLTKFKPLNLEIGLEVFFFLTM